MSLISAGSISLDSTFKPTDRKLSENKRHGFEHNKSELLVSTQSFVAFVIFLEFWGSWNGGGGGGWGN
jgi:hypothetical protein